MGTGTLFCVTLPVLIRYGMGVRMCAPSMPLPAEPSTRLSRVVPHEACFTTSTSGMPYLAKRPFSLATISGAESVSAMKPSTALVVSGVALAAYSGFGRMAARLPAVAAAAAVLITWRREIRPLTYSLIVFSLSLGSPRNSKASAVPVPKDARSAKQRPGWGRTHHFDSGGRCVCNEMGRVFSSS